jgi:hypothetical protein
VSGKGDWAKIHLQKGKTALPNEIQVIQFHTQHSVLDPVKALKRIARANPKKEREALFFQSNNGPITKKVFMNNVEKVWGKSSLERWTGHSFRVGGASLRANLGTPEKVIQRVGRWKSDSVKRYIKQFSHDEIEATKKFLETIKIDT